MLPETCQIALKEWAVTVDALAAGRQVVLLRKGGIHEDGQDFRVIHREFLLYPTYEHQKPELLRPEHRPALDAVLQQPRDEQRIVFTHFARVEEALEIVGQQQVDDLAPHYIWTTGYAQSRLRWKPMLPLAVLLLRTYRLETPAIYRWQPEYGGCTSWVELLRPAPLGQLEPALDEAEFRRQVDEIKGSLGLAVAAG